jgi:hypothetical protein
MNIKTKITAIIAILSIALSAIGCKNKAGMESGSIIKVTDSAGNEYVIEHEVLEIYRVKRLPE